MRTRGKTVPQYVRRREHTEEDLQPRKLYYSGRLAPDVENKDRRNKGFFIYLFYYYYSLALPLQYFYLPMHRVRMFFVIHQGRNKKKKK
jgi:hypothetical protein